MVERDWIARVRQVATFGMLAYLVSFYFVGGTQQKTLFYLLVALPGFFALTDFRQILREFRVPAFLILIFLAYFSLTSLWSDEGQFLDSLTVALSIGCLMIAANATIDRWPNSARLLCYYILAIGVAASVFYLALVFNKASAADGYTAILSGRFALRDWSGLGDGNPINSAVYFGLIALAAWWLFPDSRVLVKVGLLVLIAAAIAIMFLSKSRGPILSLGLVLVLVSALRRRKDDLILGCGVLLFCGLAAVFFDLTPLVLDRANEPNYRLDIWSKSLQLIKGNLFFGQGAGQSADIPFFAEGNSIVTVTHSHSSLLEAFRVGGIVGGTLFLVMVMSVLHRSLTVAKDHGFIAAWLIYGLLCLSTNGRSLLIRPSVEWFCFWIPLFFALFASREKPTVRPG